MGSDAVWLAAIPFIGSLLSLAFEAGYLSYYDVPATFIHLDLPQIAAASVFVVLFGSILVSLFELIARIARGKHPVRQALALPLIRGFILFPFVLLIPYSSVKWLCFAGFVLILVLLEFAPPLFVKSEDSYLGRLGAQVELARSEDALKESVGGHVKGLLGTSMMIGLLVAFLGYNYASQREQYFVMKGQDLAIVTNYGDLVLLKSFDPATGRLAAGFTVLKIGSERVSFFERAGRLIRK